MKITILIISFSYCSHSSITVYEYMWVIYVYELKRGNVSGVNFGVPKLSIDLQNLCSAYQKKNLETCFNGRIFEGGFAFSGNLFLGMKEKVFFPRESFFGNYWNSVFIRIFFSLLMNSKQMFEDLIWIYLFIYLSIHYIFIVGSLQTQSCI